MNKHLKQVLEWSGAFNRYISSAPKVDIPQDQKELRIKLLLEEVDELREALENNDLIEAADAVGDIQFVLDGTVLALGLQNYIEEINDEIYKSNMTKLVNGKYESREDGKITKPSTFEPPKLKEILERKLELDKLYLFKEGDYTNILFKVSKILDDGYKLDMLTPSLARGIKAKSLISFTIKPDELWKIYEYKS